jgi:parvulin-like peptidyl-prolyl isomerase
VFGSAGTGCERWPWEPKAAATPAVPAEAPPQAPAMPWHGNVPAHELVAKANQGSLSVTDVELAVREVRQLMEAYGQEWKPLSTQDLGDQMDLHDIVNNLVDTELKAQDARGRGLDRGAEVQQRLAYLQRGFYAQEWERAMREQSAPTEEEIHAFYEQSKAMFVDPERIRVRQIVAASLSEAESVRSQVITGADFAALARSVSVGAGKEEGGDIGWHMRAFDLERLRQLGMAPAEQVFFPQLEPLAFALDVKQVSQPVKGPDGRFYLVQLEERTAAKQQTELEMHDGIKELLTLNKMQETLKGLRDKAKIESFPERLEDVEQQ